MGRALSQVGFKIGAHGPHTRKDPTFMFSSPIEQKLCVVGSYVYVVLGLTIRSHPWHPSSDEAQELPGRREDRRSRPAREAAPRSWMETPVLSDVAWYPRKF